MTMTSKWQGLDAKLIIDHEKAMLFLKLRGIESDAEWHPTPGPIIFNEMVRKYPRSYAGLVVERCIRAAKEMAERMNATEVGSVVIVVSVAKADEAIMVTEPYSSFIRYVGELLTYKGVDGRRFLKQLEATLGLGTRGNAWEEWTPEAQEFLAKMNSKPDPQEDADIWSSWFNQDAIAASIDSLGEPYWQGKDDTCPDCVYLGSPEWNDTLYDVYIHSSDEVPNVHIIVTVEGYDTSSAKRYCPVDQSILPMMVKAWGEDHPVSLGMKWAKERGIIS